MTAMLLAVACVSLSGALTWKVRAMALRLNIIDAPNARSSHTRATPRGGGLALVVTFYVALGALVLAQRTTADVALAFLPGIAIAAIGWVDDRRGVGTLSRFVVHLVCAVLGVLAVHRLSGGTNEVWRVAIESIAVAAAINFYNFMDGIDGLAGVEAVSVGGLGLVLLTIAGASPNMGLPLVAVTLAASSVGFLIWNWPPARIFLGDVGSGFLGYAFAIFALAASGTTTIPLTAWVVLGGVFAVDATLTLVRRMLRGERWFAPHRLHAYQRASRYFKSHKRVTAAALWMNLVLALFGVVMTARPSYAVPALLAALACLVAVYLWVERRSPMFDPAS